MPCIKEEFVQSEEFAATQMFEFPQSTSDGAGGKIRVRNFELEVNPSSKPKSIILNDPTTADGSRNVDQLRISRVVSQSYQEAVIRNNPKNKKSHKSVNIQPLPSVQHPNKKVGKWDVKYFRGIVYGCKRCKYCSKYLFAVYKHMRDAHKCDSRDHVKFYV